MNAFAHPGVLAAIVLVGAAALRFLGVDYGLPHPLVSDEEILIGGTLRMAQTQSFVPTLDPELAAQLYYPVGLPYAYLLLFAPLSGAVYLLSGMPGFGMLPGLLLENLGYFFLAARVLSAVLGVATVFIAYRLAAAMFASPAAGVVCAALLATSWFHVVLSHFARHWSATVFFAWLAVWIAWRYWQSPSARRAVGCALAAGAGFAVGYIAVLGYAAFVLAHLARYRTAFLNRYLFAGGAVLVSCIAASAVLHLPAITRLVGGDAPVLPVEESKSVAAYFETLAFYLQSLLRAEPVLLVLGAVGGGLSLLRFPWLTGMLAVAFLGYTLFLDLFMPLEDRYILPALPALALLAAGGFETARQVVRGGRVPRLIVTSLVAVCVSYAAWNAATVTRLLMAADSRELAAAWVSENADPSSLAVVALNPVKLPASQASLTRQADLAPGSLDFVDRYRLERGDAKGREVLHVHRFGDERLAGHAAQALLAGLDASGARFFVFAQRHDLPRSGLHALVAERAAPSVVIDPARDGVTPPDLRTTILVKDHSVQDYSRLERLGPRIEIYDLGTDR
ncbi:MAG: glycosyltransferase family 39 protein [Alphaproteobacteria bacterium]|nr:glycosyltransferase family 39 protein [Alphaproteobacteria bacterium]